MTEREPPVIVWFRRDLRLRDHAALTAAAQTGRPVIPVFICDEVFETLGAASKWRLDQALASFGSSLQKIGSRLILRKGPALTVLQELLAETGATTVYWQRAYDPDSVARDTGVKAALKAGGVEAKSFAGALLHEPWTVQNGQGGDYKVYSAFRRAVWHRQIAGELLDVPKLRASNTWPASAELESWSLAKPMNRGAQVLAQHNSVGEAKALATLDDFTTNRISRYQAERDLPASDACSGLSPFLTWGEISIARCWASGQKAAQQGQAGSDKFLSELLWRDFAAYLMWHHKELATVEWRAEWQNFPWLKNADHPHFQAWIRGRTGVPLVDAGMRELYVTGQMHNRVRMIVASYLTKHLQMDWRLGMDWFADCLTDWDPASNAMGWQWVAGCGPDASPYFRVFNPETQRQKFDPQEHYINRWLAEGRSTPEPSALSYFKAVPKTWSLSADSDYPAPVVGLSEGRAGALARYEAWKDSRTNQ